MELKLDNISLATPAYWQQLANWPKLTFAAANVFCLVDAAEYWDGSIVYPGFSNMRWTHLGHNHMQWMNGAGQIHDRQAVSLFWDGHVAAYYPPDLGYKGTPQEKE